MNLTVYSRNRLYETFSKWDVPKDFANPMYNYLIYGYQPGSFFTYVLANNFAKAILSSHPGNTIEALKHLVGWMRDTLPEETWGNYDKVDVWCDMPWAMRRPILEKHRLIYTEKEEVMLILKEESAVEPILY
jgi:Txe/YoeB family toxin of Txe-Axe toxin-antitoxin module